MEGKRLVSFTTAIILMIWTFSFGSNIDTNDIKKIFKDKNVKVDVLSEKEMKETKGKFASAFVADTYYFYDTNRDGDFSWVKLGEITVHESIYGLRRGKGWDYSDRHLYISTSDRDTPRIEIVFDLEEGYNPKAYYNFVDASRKATEKLSGNSVNWFDEEIISRTTDPSILVTDSAKLIRDGAKLFIELDFLK
jgi:hypothetical protein